MSWSPAVTIPCTEQQSSASAWRHDQLPGLRRADMAGRERRPLLGEVEGNLALAAVEHADREPPGAAHRVERSCAVAEGDEHDQRVERDRREAVQGHAGRPPAYSATTTQTPVGNAPTQRRNACLASSPASRGRRAVGRSAHGSLSAFIRNVHILPLGSTVI